MRKLEILDQFKKIYGDAINPELISVKYCQTETDALVEMVFSKGTIEPAIINLDFISDDSEQADIPEGERFPLLFNPESDIVDNAKCLIELEPYSLIMCVDNLFTNTAAQEIALKHSPIIKNNISSD